MKVTLILKSNEKQIVLTPETDNEKSIFDLFAPANVRTEIEIFQGGFELEKCIGGWLREFEHKDSIILYLNDNKLPADPRSTPRQSEENNTDDQST
jgi:hypothetical protein